MSQDYELEILASVRMRQHREAAQRLRNIAQAEKAARGQSEGRAGFSLAYSLAYLVRLLAPRRRNSVDRQNPVHEDS